MINLTSLQGPNVRDSSIATFWTVVDDDGEGVKAGVAGGEEPIGGESEDPGTWGPGLAQIFNSHLKAIIYPSMVRKPPDIYLFLRSGLRQFLQLPQFGLWHSAHCLHGLAIFTTEYLPNM